MKLNITATTTIAEIQHAFTACFPFLKMEFFTKPHGVGEASWTKYMIFEHTKPLNDIETFKSAEGDYTFTAEMTVADFEQGLWEQYGLSVQVFRKSMSSWIESTTTDKWTLAYQNQKGEESSHSMPEMIYVERSSDD